MKRFLILSILIVFLTVSCAGPNKVTVSCAGPNKVRYRIPDYLQNEFENDQKECSDSIDKNLNSDAFGKALEECLEKKGYIFEKPQKPPSTGSIVLTIAGVIVGIPLAAAYIALQVLGRGGGFHGH